MNEVLLSWLGIIFIFLMTTFGATTVLFFKKEISEKFNKIFLGFAAGVMMAASIWSLILPSIEEANKLNISKFLPLIIGILFGGVFILVLDRFVPKLVFKEKRKLKRNAKMYLAVTIHNIPEGLVVGLAFGLALKANDPSMLYGALALALGIGLQNIPEGAALAIPMLEDTKSKKKAFLYGMSSGIVEPIFAAIGLFLASILSFITPWALSFAAGAMIYVVVEELIPESNTKEHPYIGTFGFIIGFLVMMILDIALS